MSNIDAFIIRKPWYIVLEHAKQSQGIATNFLALRAGKKPVLFSKTLNTKSIEDEDFCKKEIEFNEEHNIKYKETISLTDQTKSYVAKAIEKFWKLQLTDKKIGFPINQDDYQYIIKAIAKERDTFNSYVDTPVRNYTGKNNWNNPNGTKHLSTINGLAVCVIAEIILKKAIKFKKENGLNKDLSELEEDLITVEKIKKIIELAHGVKLSSDEEKNKFIYDQHLSFWQSNIRTIPLRFQNAHFFCYERTDGNSKSKDNPSIWGIAKYHIEIKEVTKQNVTPIFITTKIDGTKYYYEGIVTFDTQSKCMIASTIRNIKKDSNLATPTFYILPINDEEDQTLSVGYTIYFSTISKRFVSKTIIWQLMTDEEINSNKTEPIDLDSRSDDFEIEIDINIRRFLRSRLRNRLTMPSLNISNLDNQDLNRYRSLETWLNKRISNIDSDTTLEGCVDKYFVCYFIGDIEEAKIQSIVWGRSNNASDIIQNSDDYIAKNIRVDELEIKFDEDEVEFIADYKHAQKEGNNTVPKPNRFDGLVRKNGSTIEIVLEEKDPQFSDSRNPSAYKTTLGNYILLTFCVPDVHKIYAKKTFNSIDYFPGIISGLNDDNNNPVSFRAIIIKRKISDAEEIKELNLINRAERNILSKQIIQYFRRNLLQSQIRVFPMSDSFSDKYPNIDILILNGGQINISEKKNNAGDYGYTIICLTKEKEPLSKEEFTALTADEALKKADQWLLDNYTPIAETQSLVKYPNIQKLLSQGGEIRTTYKSNPNGKGIICQASCINKRGELLSDESIFYGNDDSEAFKNAENWLLEYFANEQGQTD